ncbi:MAG: hypothetical protein GX088_02330 [Clostridia bacterium]|nr:hypothetical protein [Clostridia bacterium]
MAAIKFGDQVQRNRRKFFMKYGFDLIQYVNLEMIGKTEDEIIDILGIFPFQLEKFKRDRTLRKLKPPKKRNQAF